MSRRPLLIVKTGSALPAVQARRGDDFEDWIADGMGFAFADVQVVDVCDGEELPEPAAICGVAITGSAAFVSQPEPWSLRTAEWLPGVVDAGVPLLGICYGHQLLAVAFGGRVGPNPRGREMGTVRVDLSAARRERDALLGHLPAVAHVQTTHVESVLELPPGASLLGGNDIEPIHAFSYGDNAWGVQFHPEFDGNVMRGYIEARADVLRAEGLDPEELLAGARGSPHGPAILHRFGEIVRDA